MTNAKLFVVGVLLTISNFAHQCAKGFFLDRAINYADAIERSYFQCIALVAVGFFMWVFDE